MFGRVCRHFADVAAADRRGLVLQTADGLQLLLAEVVSDNYFTFMGVKPEIGTSAR